MWRTLSTVKKIPYGGPSRANSPRSNSLAKCRRRSKIGHGTRAKAFIHVGNQTSNDFGSRIKLKMPHTPTVSARCKLTGSLILQLGHRKYAVGAQFMLVPSFGSTTRVQDQIVLAVVRQNGIPVLEANVGLLLLVSNGEIVERLKTNEGMILGKMAVPAARNQKNRMFKSDGSW